MADKRESTVNSEMARVDSYSLSDGYQAPKFSLESQTGNIYATGDVSVKVAVEVSEAITGLKALQREAKAATRALAELREEQAKGPYKGEMVDGKKLVWLDEGEQIVPITEPTVYLDGKTIREADGKGVRR
ncbi:hypothetical protein [Bacillus velezensis]|uniref:hypothetical protein n=1 Tax=Bacillus velezensis TaxID=492670 RepID=UPI001EF47D49|nr:hypothetical protein [Bacillus velezensis]